MKRGAAEGQLSFVLYSSLTLNPATHLLIPNNQDLVVAINGVFNLGLIVYALYLHLVAQPLAKFLGPILDQGKRADNQSSINGL